MGIKYRERCAQVIDSVCMRICGPIEDGNGCNGENFEDSVFGFSMDEILRRWKKFLFLTYIYLYLRKD